MSFQTPKKVILLPEQLAYFQTSKTHQTLVSYIEALNKSVTGVKLTDECSESPVSMAIVGSDIRLMIHVGCSRYLRYIEPGRRGGK